MNSALKTPLIISRGLLAMAPEVEIDSRRITEIVLIRVVEPIAKVGEQIIHPGRSNGHNMTHRNIYATAKCKCKGIAGRRSRKRTGSQPRRANALKCIRIHVRVRASNQEMNEGLDTVRTNLNLGAEQIGEHITLNVGYRSAGEERTRRNEESIRVTSVALQIRFEPKVLVDVVDQSSASAIQAVTLGENGTGVVVDVRVVKSQFGSGELLRPTGYTQ